MYDGPGELVKGNEDAYIGPNLSTFERTRAAAGDGEAISFSRPGAHVEPVMMHIVSLLHTGGRESNVYLVVARVAKSSKRVEFFARIDDCESRSFDLGSKLRPSAHLID